MGRECSKNANNEPTINLATDPRKWDDNKHIRMNLDKARCGVFSNKQERDQRLEQAKMASPERQGIF